jgi:hypothetical protein
MRARRSLRQQDATNLGKAGQWHTDICAVNQLGTTQVLCVFCRSLCLDVRFFDNRCVRGMFFLNHVAKIFWRTCDHEIF